METLTNQTLAEHNDTTTSNHLALSESLNDELTHTSVVLDEVEKPHKNPIKIILTITKCLGAATVALAMGLFLFEGLSVTGDIQRFFTIAGFGALMTALGLTVYHFLNDRVASRLFLALSMGSIPIVTAVLGGLIFSLTGAAKKLEIPNYVTWTLPDQASLYIALPIGLLSVAAIATFGFMVMARSEWRWMTPALLIINTMMLIPTRDTVVITTLAVISIGALFWLIKHKTNNRNALQTLEGGWALLLLFIGPIVSVGRTAFLYDHNALMLAGVATLLFLGARYWLHHSEPGTKYSFAAMILSSVLALFAILHYVCYLEELPFVFERRVTLYTVQAVLAALLILAVQFDLSRQNAKHFIAKAQTSLTCLFAGVWLMQPYLENGEFYVKSLALLIALAFATLHWQRGNRASAGILAACSLFMLAFSGNDILSTLIHSGWWGLAATGSAIIVGGAAAERTLSKMKPKPKAEAEDIPVAG